LLLQDVFGYYDKNEIGLTTSKISGQAGQTRTLFFKMLIGAGGMQFGLNWLKLVYIGLYWFKLV